MISTYCHAASSQVGSPSSDIEEPEKKFRMSITVSPLEGGESSTSVTGLPPPANLSTSEPITVIASTIATISISSCPINLSTRRAAIIHDRQFLSP
jgi:hypothetical protein